MDIKNLMTMCVMSLLIKNKAPETKEVWKLKQFVFFISQAPEQADSFKYS